MLQASRMPMRAALKAQRGASMPVALMLLLVMSLIAVTSLNTTMLEEKMAVNTQHQITVFQGAESGIDKVINSPDTLSALASSRGSTRVEVSFSSNAKTKASVHIAFVKLLQTDSAATADATETGTSWAGGKGGSDFPTVFFRAESLSYITSNPDINTTLVQGFKWGMGDR